MKILSAARQRALDVYTITHEPVSSIDLMERAAGKAFNALLHRVKPGEFGYFVICGSGNNGGDGMAIARMLHQTGKSVSVYELIGNNPSADFIENRNRLASLIPIQIIKSEADFPRPAKDDVIIDALLGTGITRPAEGAMASLIQHINQTGVPVYSIDLPSGLFADTANNETDAVVHATHTFTFHAPKLSFFCACGGKYTGNWEVLDIGLLDDGKGTSTDYLHFTRPEDILPRILKRNRFGYKNQFGHALMCAGSKGMGGAAILSVKACLRSGAGLVTACIPGALATSMLITNPEALCVVDSSPDYLLTQIELEKYSSIGVGPGIGQTPETSQWLCELIPAASVPMVLDADALNILSHNKEWLRALPKGSILTPHIGEFDRLFGKQPDEITRWNVLREKAMELNLVIVLKSAYTAIAFPDGSVHVNSTGNAGMAKGGSGDVLTGLLTGLMARGYTPANAALLGVYWHGLSGDMAAAKQSDETMTALSLIDTLSDAWKELSKVVV